MKGDSLNNMIVITYPKEDLIFGPHVFCQHGVNETFPLHTHDSFYEFFMLTEGKAIHHVNGQDRLLEKGSAIYMRPSDKHYYEAVNYFNFKLVNVGFPQNLVLPVLDYLGISLSQICSPECPLQVEINGEAFEHIKHSLITLSQMFPSYECAPYFRSIASELFYPIINKNCNKAANINIPKWLVDLDHEMNQKENYIIGTKRIYEICHYSQPYIIRSFVKYLNCTPTEYINEKRMTYACELLISMKYNITDICYISGFNNLSYFYEVFRNTYHCSPKEFIINHT